MTWSTREEPILEAILVIEEEDEDRVVSTDLAATVGLAEAEVLRAMTALYDADYVTWSSKVGLGATETYIVPRLLERGRRSVGQWPADGFDALVAILDDRIRTELAGDERTRLDASGTPWSRPGATCSSTCSST